MRIQIVVGTPPDSIMEDARMATPFGAVMAGKELADHQQSLNEQEVKLGFSLGRWTAQVQLSACLHQFTTFGSK